jgi:glucose 1-dehydrogenase
LGIAQSLAEAGYRVAMWDLLEDVVGQAADEITERGGSALPIRCDVTDEGSVAAATQRVVDEFGRPHVLVNNAGIVRVGALAEMTLEDWRATIDVNLTGPFICTQAVGRHMLDAREGSIVNVASLSALMPQPYRGSYSPSKAGVVQLTALTALEWGSRGIRCNAILPGPVRTWISESVYAVPELYEGRRRLVASRRIADASEMGSVVLFLASDAASYVNGASIPVDGGMGLMTLSHVPSLVDDERISRHIDELDAREAAE